MGFTPKQVQQLLLPINPRRVLKDGKGHSHVSQQDVTAHLIRVFGFGNFRTEVLQCDAVYVNEREGTKRFDVGYRAMVRLTIMDDTGTHICSFENVSMGVAQNQTLGDAHDLAMKSAVSVAMKRCAINLGDQFGLSLYNKGQMTPLVMGTMVGLETTEKPKEDLQDGVAQQESLGTDENVYDDHLRPEGTDQPTAEAQAILEKSLGATPVEATS